MRTSLRSGLCVALVLAAAGCGSSLPTENDEMTSAVIGTAGGMLASSDGTLRVAIPAGALPGDVTVTIVPTMSPGSGAIGTVYELGPTGTQFAIPVTLTFGFSPNSLGTTDPALLRVATFAAGSWRILSGASLDPKGLTVSGTTTHLSPYGLTSAATGAMCATVSGGVSCSGGTDNGSGAGTAGMSGGVVASGGTTGAGGVTVSCTPSTCADATNACAAYPGATMTGCTDGPNGFMATCCFPSGGSICSASRHGRLGLRRGLRRRRGLHHDMSAGADLRRRDGRHHLRRPHGRDRSELRRRRERLHRRVLLRARSAGLRDGRRGARLRRVDEWDDDLRTGADLR